MQLDLLLLVCLFAQFCSGPSCRTSDAGAAKPVNPSDSIPTSPLSPTFPQPSKEEPPAFPLGASTQPMTFSSLVGSSLPEHSLRSPFGDAARLTSPYQDTPRRSYLDSRPYGASPGLFSSVFHRSDSGSLGLGVAAWKPEDYLRTDAGFRKDGVAELGEGARAGSLGRTPSEATKLKDAVLASLGESGGVLESGQKTPPPQARAEPSEKSEEQASPMQVDESAAAEGSAEGERRTEGEEEEELGGTEKPGERAARETGGPGEPSKDVILSEMEQVDSEIERLEKQLSRMASLEKSGTMASTPTAQALAEATGIVGVQAEAMKGAQEGEKPEGLSRETGDGQVTGSKQPADGTGLEKEEGPTEEEGPEEGGEAAVEEGPAKGRTPKASEGPPSSKAGSLKWKWAAAGNGNLPLDTSAGKHESEAAAQETPVEEAAAKPEEDAAEVKEAAPAVQVKWEFNPLALGGPDPFLKFEQIIASQDGLARYLAEQHPAPPRAVAKVEPKADELILSAGCQDRAVFVQARIWANREAARRSEAGLQHLLPAGCQLGDGPLYTCPEEAPYWRTNEEAHARIEEALLTRLQEKKRDLQFTEHVLALR